MSQPIVEVTTTNLVAGGAALGRLPDGRAVFVEGGAPDEFVRIELTHEDKRWAKGRIVEIMEPSTSRVEPPFPDSALGGAQWAHIDYPAQLAAKQQIVRTALERIGKLPNPSIEQIVPSPQQWRYRSRIELTFGKDSGRVTLGTLAPGSATEVIPATDVALLKDVVRDIIPRVVQWAEASELGVWDPRIRTGTLRSLVLRRSLATNDLVINLIVTSAMSPDQRLVEALSDVPTTGILWSISPTREHLRGDRLFTSEEFPGDSVVVLSGSDTLTEVVASCQLTYHATSFFQVNVPAVELLIERLQTVCHSERPRSAGADQGVEESGREVIDLYAGVGLLGLTTTPSRTPLTLVEADTQASRDTLTNVERLARLDTTTIVAASAEDYVAGYRLPVGATVIVDPPRTGLNRTVVDALLNAQLDKLIYVSCDSATLARDLNLLSARYTPTFIQPFDFFPQTPHVETLVELLPRSG